MHSFTTILIAALSASLVGSQSIDPTTVPLSTRTSWCQDQKNACPLLCLQTSNSATTTSNTCDASNLAWTCVCKNGLTPNATEFSLTIPYHICQEYGNQCVAKCGQDNACSTNCRTQYKCGASDPTKVNSTSSSSAAAATGSGTASGGNFNSFGGGSSSGAAGGSAAMAVGQSVAAAVVMLGVVGGMMMGL